MYDLSELEMRMLSELEEGHQDFPLLLHKTTDRKGNKDEISAVQEAVRNLIRQGLVAIEMSSIPTGFYEIPLKAAEKEVEQIALHLKFRPETEMWVDARSGVGFSVARPEVVLTEIGEQEAERILEERGMWWWHPQTK